MEIKSPFTKKLGIKRRLLDLKLGEQAIFPREKITSVRTTLSVLRLECPDKVFDYGINDQDEFAVILIKEKRDPQPTKQEISYGTTNKTKQL